jgi:type I restriction enzyme, R subunit
MAHAYSEDSLVEQPAIQLFSEMRWQTVSALEEFFGVGSTLGRETKSEVVLVPRLRAALDRLNPSLPPEAISGAIESKRKGSGVLISCRRSKKRLPTPLISPELSLSLTR